MLADPQSITIDGTATSCGRVLTGTELGRFVAPNQSVSLEVQTSRSGRLRTVARLRSQKVTSDPLVSSTNVVVSDTIALTINRPLEGFSDADIEKQVVGFFGWLTAGTNANLKKILAGEN